MLITGVPQHEGWPAAQVWSQEESFVQSALGKQLELPITELFALHGYGKPQKPQRCRWQSIASTPPRTTSTSRTIRGNVRSTRRRGTTFSTSGGLLPFFPSTTMSSRTPLLPARASPTRAIGS